MDKQVKQALQIQQLVDGSLSHSDRSNWLLSLDDDSTAWRDIALEFVQKQILDEALGATGVLLQPTSISEKDIITRSKRPLKPLPAGTWWAIAASLVLGLWLGSLLFSGGPESSVASRSPADRSNLAQPANLDNHQLLLADALARSVNPVSLDARRAFLKAGYVVDEQKTIADVQLPSGDLVQLPVRKFNVQYLGNATYQ